MKWEEFFFKQVYLIASKSKDERTHIGSLLVLWNEKDVISSGFNGFPRFVNDNIKERHQRPEKYFWTCHSETNAILQCARTGRSSNGTTLITNGIPCADCCKNLIQGGIIKVIVHRQWQDYEKKLNWEKWIDSSKRSEIMLREARINVEIFDQYLGVEGFLDGNIIKV